MSIIRDRLSAEHEARKELLRQQSIARVRARWRMSRRAVLLGIGALGLGARSAFADTAFTNFSYTVGPETTGITTPARFAYVVNVKGFGAVGDGVADDTKAFQDAFNAAFKATGGGGNGSGNAWLNVKVIIPPGKYRITSPLYIINCLGGIIEGFGNGVSQLLWRPTNGATIPGGGTYSGSGNSFNPGGGQTPCIMTDGVAYMQFNSFGLEGPTSGVAQVTGIDIWQTTPGTNGQSTANTFRNINFTFLGQGILADGANGCDNGLVEQCQFSTCSYAGISIASANALNWNIHGGGASNCGLGVGGVGAYYVSTGGLCIYDPSTTTNLIDFSNNYGSAMAIVGGSSESQKVAFANTGPVILTGVSVRMGPTDTSFPFDLTGGGGGIMSVNGCWINCNSNTGAGGHIAQLGNSGILTLNGGVIADVAAAHLDFTGTPGSKIYCQGTFFAGTNASRLTNFTGTNVGNAIGTGIGAFP